MYAFFVATLLAACASPETAAPAGPAPYRLEERGTLPLRGAMDVWGEGDVAVLAGGLNPDADVLVADIADPDAPRALSTIDGLGQVRDVHLEDDLLYVASDCNCRPGTPEMLAWDHVGVRIYDLSDPSRPQLLSTLGPPTESVHNLHVADGLLYATSFLEGPGGSIVIFDVSDPSAPFERGRWSPPAGVVHDQTAVGDRLYVAHMDGFSVVDVSDPGAPRTVQSVSLMPLAGPGARPSLHNVWPLRDPRYVATSEERIGGPMTIWDLDRAAPVARVPEADDPNCVHNVQVVGDRVYAAWYLDGVRVFDVADPAAPALLGEVDTLPGPAPEPPEAPPNGGEGPDPSTMPIIRGAWGTWVDAGRVVVGDTDRGLVVLTESGG
jgi:hypothetical protein